MFGLELYTSRESTMGKDPSVTLMFLVHTDTDNEREVREFVLLEAPKFYGDVPIPRLCLWPLKSKQTPLGNQWWMAQVDYGIGGTQTDRNPNDQNQNGDKAGQNDPLTPDVQISGKGVQQTITQSLRTVQKEKGQGDARDIPDYKGAIQVSKQGVKGCEIPVPAMTWSETWTWQARFVTWGYIRALRNLIGRTNAATFRINAAGEAMFDGFESSPHGLNQRKITYHFASSPNVVIPAGTFKNKDGQALPVINKDGFQYIWFEYEEYPLASAIAMAPRTAYVEEVGRPGLTGPNGATNQDDFTGILRIGS